MYNFKKIEEKWRKYWAENETFHTDVWDFSKPKFYALDMFPYPSGVGLHAGHAEGYTATDIISRMKRMQGYNVLHPMGYDSFGLPAEQYAVTTGNHPNGFTEKNIDTFTNQLKSIGFDYDWSKLLKTSDPKFYKWTQWIFKQLYLDGYAKYIDMPVNWCEELGTVLSNDEVIDGKSERGGFPVVRKNMKQWVIDQVAFAEALLEGLDEVDWPESTKEMQRNWIGKSVGAHVTFKVKDFEHEFVVFTTRPDTLFGVTYCVMAPEHGLVDMIVSDDKKVEVETYKKQCASKSDLERTELNHDKTGVFIGAYEFAKKFDIPIIPVLEGGDITVSAFTEDGIHINSDFLDGMNKEDAITAIISWLEENACGSKHVNYKMREWIFARQRYWGEPMPVVYLEDGNIHILDDNELPLILPELGDYKGHGGKAPLENAKEWKEYHFNDKCGHRETSTMPGSAGSSWYYLRYIDPNNEDAFANQKLLEHWMPVDLYVGGPEHAVGHLMYARIWNHYLYNKGLSPVKEPFKKLVHQGMILGANGIKMGKRYPDYAIDPLDIVRDYGADTLRLYEMFMGPLEASKPWNNQGVEGAQKFLDRIYRLYESGKISDLENKNLEKIYHQTVKKVTEDFETLNFNTAISQMMIFINAVYKEEVFPRAYAEGFIKLLNPVAPHITEELWEMLGYTETIAYETWPSYDESILVEAEKEIADQVNVKLRTTINLLIGMQKSQRVNIVVK